jgi:hypothetical protein
MIVHRVHRALAFAAVLAAAACGDKGPDMYVKPPSPDQGPLAQALASVCAAPNRAEHDPAFGDPGGRDQVLSDHLDDNVTHPKVLEAIEGWRSDQKPTEDKVKELDALLNEAGLQTPCRLRDVWSDPDWGASEVAPPPESADSAATPDP